MAERLRELRETFSFHLKKNDSETVLAFAFKFIGKGKVYNLLIKSLVGEQQGAWVESQRPACYQLAVCLWTNLLLQGSDFSSQEGEMVQIPPEASTFQEF